MIKVIGGIYRSRNLKTPDNGTEPTKNMVRGAMISSLHSSLESAHVLDLFAGSGALGIEALSQGADFCHFVDFSKDAITVIKDNLSTLKIDNADVTYASFERFLQSYDGKPFDIVFLDPPYALKESYQQALDLLFSRGLLSPLASVVMEYEGEIDVDLSSFKEVRDYRYGKTKVKLARYLQ